MDQQQGALDGLLPLVGTVGAPALCGLFVLLVMTGQLVPKRLVSERIKEVVDSFTRVVQGKDDVIAEQARYIGTLETHLGLYARSANTTEQVVRALQVSQDSGSD